MIRDVEAGGSNPLTPTIGHLAHGLNHSPARHAARGGSCPRITADFGPLCQLVHSQGLTSVYTPNPIGDHQQLLLPV